MNLLGDLALFTQGGPSEPGYDIIVYPGQSNTTSQGVGVFTDSDPSFDGSCFQVGRFFPNRMQIIPMSDPLQPINPLHWWSRLPTCRPYGVTFAREYAKRYLATGRSVGLVPAAKTGTSILQWMEIIASPVPLYDNMADEINLFLSQPGVNRIVAWVENQGESDVLIANDPDDPRHVYMDSADTYLARKLDFIDRARSDFGIFPMLFGLFSDDWLPCDPMKLAFEDAIRSAAASRPLCAATRTRGVQSNTAVDPAEAPNHFSNAGQEDMAQRHFAAFNDLLARNRLTDTLLNLDGG